MNFVPTNTGVLRPDRRIALPAAHICRRCGRRKRNSRTSRAARISRQRVLPSSRFEHFWPGGPDLVNVAGDRKLDEFGNRALACEEGVDGDRYLANGEEEAGDPCFCGPPVEMTPCDQCPDGEAPAAWVVTFIGVTDYSICTNAADGSGWTRISTTVNSSFTLLPSQNDEENPDVITPCLWSYPQKTFESPFTGIIGRKYSASGCATITETENLRIFLQRGGANIWSLRYGPGLEEATDAFQDDITDPSCDGPFTFTNAIISPGFRWGYGGAATAVSV